DDIGIKSVCLAGGSEINSNVRFIEQRVHKSPVKSTLIDAGEHEAKSKIETDDSVDGLQSNKEAKEETKEEIKEDDQTNFGFVVGDVSSQEKSTPAEPESRDQDIDESKKQDGLELEEEELVVSQEHALEIEDFEQEMSASVEPKKGTHKGKFNLKQFILKGNFTIITMIAGVILALVLIGGAWVFLPKANVKIFVEPKIVERDSQVVADPNQKSVDEEAKIIPGQIVETEISGSAKDSASGKRQIGESSKGTIVIYNKTFDSLSLNKGAQISSQGGIKFTLDTNVVIASASASDSGISFGKLAINPTVTAVAIGADGNISSGTDMAVAGYSSDKLMAKSEGNFFGGTSKDVTVVSSEDTQRLLAKLSSELRQQSQQKLQEKYPDKKILQEALSENIVKKSYNKNINDQANEFSLNMTISYKGTAFEDNDLKSIVSKLVDMQVPDGFKLDITATETQADVSKLEKDGKLIFLARFKAKLIPMVDTNKIKDNIKFKSYSEALSIIKETENVLGSEINITPALPKMIQRIPILSKNITIEVGLK
ncbi:baseplate J/gp47 family protein, partial [Patescibacteria group bacterium]|nr:baseplate J/gp47 family protein [Patescibacteria group bacterium]